MTFECSQCGSICLVEDGVDAVGSGWCGLCLHMYWCSGDCGHCMQRMVPYDPVGIGGADIV